MPLVQRYSNTLRGAMTLTGNTLGFSSNGGAFSGIAAFLSTNPALSAPGYPTPSTLNWASNGSSAQLNIPPGSTIEYAELIWGGSTVNFSMSLPPGTIDTPITFKTPLSNNTIIFDPATAFTGLSPGVQIFYTRSQIVTNLVKSAGAGTYEVDGVPATLSDNPQRSDGFTSAGWALFVVYSNPSLYYSNIQSYVGNLPIGLYAPPVDTNISGFATPSLGPINARVVVSAMQGDSQYTNDQLLIGPNTSALTVLSGPNNPATNFFNSMINNDSGNLDTTGSFGNLNQVPGGLVASARNDWDITNVNASSAFTNAQQSAVVRLQTQGDTFSVSTLGVQIQVNLANIMPVKTVDKSYAKPGDILTYTVVLENTGLVQADNVVFTDSLPNGVTYVANSLVSSAPYAGSLNTQISLNNPILPGGKVTLSYQAVLGNTIPNPNPMVNTAKISYSSIPAPGLNPIASNDTSNTATTQVNFANLNGPNSFTKTVDNAYAKIGDIVTYTIKAKNTGTVNANSVVITDTLPNGTSFVIGSITSTDPFSGTSPTSGITLTNPIIPGEIVTMTYQTKIDVLPVPNPISNVANVNYTFTSDPANPNGNTASATTPPATTQVNNADLTSPGNFVKSADKAFADVGETITYTLTVKNTGNVSANNVIITDTLPNGTTFVPGSITSNSPFNGTNIETGVILTNPIPANGTITINYKATATTMPVPNPILNTANISYTFTSNPANPDSNSVNGISTTATTQINHADLTSPSNFTKTVDKSFVDIGDVISYTIKATNSGNIDANNVVITDILPNGTVLVPGSVVVNVLSSGTDPQSGIIITNPIVPGGFVTLTYKVTVVSMPVPNPIPNSANINYTYTSDPSKPNGSSSNGTTPTVYTEVNHADLTSPGNFVKTVDKNFVNIGDTITYTLKVSNSGNSPANNVVITDIIPSGTNFVAGSVVSSVASTGNNPATGITLNNPLSPGSSATISYKVTVTQIPVVNPIPNTGNVNYKYTVDPSAPDGATSSGPSNTVTTQVNNVDLTKPGDFTKVADKSIAIVGDIVTYTVTAKNSGNVSANNVVITDTIPNGASFVVGSITSTSIFTGTDPTSGITLTNPIPANGTVTITYKVKVNSIPNPNPMANIANVNYKYTVDPAVPNGASGNAVTPPANTLVNSADLTSPGNFTKTADKAFANVGDIITYTLKVNNTGNVSANNVVVTDTLPTGTSFVAGSITSTSIFTGTDPISGIILTNPIPAGGSVTITYKTKVNVLPLPNPIENIANVNYKFTSDPNNPNGNNSSATTPPATTQINTADLLSPGNFVKSADKDFADIGETITYTLNIKNTGNVSANNVVITDTLPNGTTFIPGSITSTDIFSGTNIETGITLSNPIPANETVTITYKVTATTMPVPNPILNTANISYKFISNPTSPNSNSVNGSSNVATTQINHADLTSSGDFIKISDKSIVDVGDVITYTINITNSGNVDANNVVVQDTLPNGTILVPGSIIVSVASSGFNPETGINIINPIAPGASVTINYKAKVTTLPTVNPMPNIANVNYTYTSDPANPNGSFANGSTPIVYTKVNHADLTSLGNFEKTVDKDFANIGDTITYTLKISNGGNIPANNVVITDPIPLGTSFVSGSLVSSVASTGTNPESGITLTNPLAPGSSVTISYKVTVTTIPIVNPIPNTGSVYYKYTVDPAFPNGSSNSGASNTVITQVNNADLTQPGDVVKVADKNIAIIGDIITYTVTIKNSGNTPANNVVITDTIPNGAIFIIGSISSLVPFSGTNPQSGITLTNPIPANGIVSISYKAKVTSIPNPNPMENVANINYKYTVDPGNPNGASGSVITPPAITKVNSANLVDPGNFVKYVDKQYADTKSILAYTFTAINTGNEPANNVIIIDTIPSGAILIPGSITSNVPFTGTNPSDGLTLTNPINPGEKVNISFKVSVDTIPSPNPLVNSGTIKYTFTSDPNKPNGNSSSVTSQPVTTQINHANINLNKTSDKQSVVVKDIITYTIEATNTGNVSSNNIVIYDTLPSSMVFVDGSITSTSPFTGDTITLGINLINPILPGDTVVITFKAQVLSSKVTNPIKNIVVVNYKYTVNPSIPNGASASVTAIDNKGVNIYNASLKLVKSTNKNYVVVGDTLTYTITATNNGNTVLGSIPDAPIMIYDILSSSLEFVPGSISVNGVSLPLQNLNKGINIETLDIGKSTIVTFDVKVLSNIINPITNSAKSSFGIQLPGELLQLGSSISNVVSVIPELANINIVKTSDKQIVLLGDTITYTVTLTNDGNLDAINVIFKDILPIGTTLLDHTFNINGTILNGVDLSKGVNIGDIQIGNTTTIYYSVKVTSPNCSMKLINSVFVNFNYILPNREIGYITIDPTITSTNEIELVITNFKQISIEGNVSLSCQKPSIMSINNLNGEIDITNSIVIQTTPSKSLEGQNLTSYKLIVNGVLKLLAEYTDCEQENIHSENFNVPFSTFIILPNNYCLDNKIEINPQIEDIYNNISNERNLFINATALINVKIISCEC